MHSLVDLGRPSLPRRLDGDIKAILHAAPGDMAEIRVAGRNRAVFVRNDAQDDGARAVLAHSGKIVRFLAVLRAECDVIRNERDDAGFGQQAVVSATAAEAEQSELV